MALKLGIVGVNYATDSFKYYLFVVLIEISFAKENVYSKLNLMHLSYKFCNLDIQTIN